MAALPDIYFTPEYGRLYEEREGGRLECFQIDTGRGCVYFQYIRRPLDMFDGYGGYSDIVTPYGYGGPVFLDTPPEDRPTLAALFARRFREMCGDTKTVSAFAAFHPLLENAADFSGVFDTVAHLRKTVAIDLTKDVLTEEFDPRVRYSLRYAARHGVAIRRDAALYTLDSFIGLYYRMLDEKGAPPYYYFSRAYFDGLKALGPSVQLYNAWREGRIIAAVLYLSHGGFLHNHLTVSAPEGRRYRAAEAIGGHRALLAAGEGYVRNHLGGGLTNDSGDDLYRFKRKFSKSPPLDYSVGKSVILPDVYGRLAAKAHPRGWRGPEYFPAYRA